ncbi:hypothetical protein CZP2022_283 [Vibrio phage C-ZP2022]|nr:hypothetical protein CZP2022_283 [Vibrio phage C-ZP2022]
MPASTDLDLDASKTMLDKLKEEYLNLLLTDDDEAIQRKRLAIDSVIEHIEHLEREDVLGDLDLDF